MGFIDLLSFLFASGLGFGLSFWIYGTLLDRSNNIGDSKGDKVLYGVDARFTTRRDNLSSSEKNSFSATYANRIDTSAGPSGSELVRRLSKEEIEEYKKAAKEQAMSYAESSAYTPVARVKTTEDEIKEWEKSMESSGDTPSPFKPI